MKTVTKLAPLICGFLLSGVIVGALAQGDVAPASMITPLTPNNCNVSTANDHVTILVSEVPGHIFIMCNATVPVQNQTNTLFLSGVSESTTPTSPWIPNPNGGSFVCAGTLADCNVMYSH